jgi:DNA-binding response OmpR family regulator
MRILVVDDELTIAEIVTDILTKDGHVVETTLNGDDAFRIYCENLSEGRPFDYVLTGLTQPGMSGTELVEAIARKNPKQRWGFSTGYPVLQRPFTREQLLAFVNMG